jgi:hypothetical protein
MSSSLSFKDFVGVVGWPGVSAAPSNKAALLRFVAMSLLIKRKGHCSPFFVTA